MGAMILRQPPFPEHRYYRGRRHYQGRPTVDDRRWVPRSSASHHSPRIVNRQSTIVRGRSSLPYIPDAISSSISRWGMPNIVASDFFVRWRRYTYVPLLRPSLRHSASLMLPTSPILIRYGTSTFVSA